MQREDALLVTYTLFPNVWPTQKTVREDVPWEDLAARIRNAATYIKKSDCPLISMAEYGDTFDASHKCLRYAENVQRVYGIELDYDGERMPIDEAADLLRGANLRAILYTSPSHTSAKPRWRALLPLSEPTLPEKRAEYTGKANQVLGGIASDESFALSQSFYIGRVRGVPYEVRETEGRCVDNAFEILPQYPPARQTNGAARDPTTDADLRASFERGENRYQAMLKLSARWAARGLSTDDIEANLLELLGSGSHNADGIDLRTRARSMADSAVRKFGESRRASEPLRREAPPVDSPPDEKEAKAAHLPPRSPLDWQSLEDRTPPEREWALQYWLPRHHVSLLAGRGGIGKTLAAQHLGTAMALGCHWVDVIERPLRVLLWAGEDDANELWRRQIGICAHFGKSLRELKSKFFLQSYEAVDITLAHQVFGLLQPTVMMAELTSQIQDYAIDYVFLDNIARLYGGNENDRHQVTQFLSWLTAACQPAGVCLLGHPAKGTGSEYSGSTAWEGAVRARLYLSDRLPDTPIDPDEPPDETVRYLSRRKSNYSPNDWRRLEMREGILVPETASLVGGTRQVSGEFAKDIVKRALRKLGEMKLTCNASTRSPDYLPRLACQYGLLDNLAEKRFGAIMRDCIKGGDLVIAQVGQYPNRTPRFGLQIAAQMDRTNGS